MLSLDPSSLITFVATSLVLLLGSFVLVRKAAYKYFFDDASFDPGEGFGSVHRMSIGGGGEESGSGSGSGGGEVCAACRGHGAKKCSRCKGVYYCSQECQSKHWSEHKLNCKKLRSSDNYDDTSRRRKTPGLSSISLVLPRGKCKVLQKPKKILFPYEEFINLFNSDKPGVPPCGLLNCGNSCFANVVLQCLTCTRPLAAYLLEKEHSRACIRRKEDWCFLCELEDHIHRASENWQPFSPTKILSRIPNIGGNLGYGSQEDAHELMRFAIDTMQSVCLDEYGGEKAVDPSTQETTLVQHIFGGHLQSQVICTKCNMVSNRYENMMDLTVEIHGDADSLEECLNQFTVKEWLDGDNKYKCDGCNDYVKACKRLTVHQAPNILTVTLKRFQRGRFGKLNKRVSFPEELDLTPYMGDAADGSDLYSLYAVVVHLDMLNASFFGHYICYTKDHYGRWYRIDDCKVTAVDVDEVLSQGAYMLLYSRRTPRKKHLAVGDVNSSNVPTAENVTRDHTNLLSLSTLCQSNPALLRDTGHDRQKSKTDDATEIKDIMESEEIVEVHERQNGKTDDATEIKYILESEEPVEGNPVRKGVSAEDMGNSELVTSVMTKDSEEGKSSRFLHNQDNAVTFNNPIDAGIITGTLCPVAVQPIEYEPDAETHVEVNKANDVAEGISSSSGDTSDVSLAISNSSGDTADVSLSSSNIAESVSKSSSSASFTSSSTEPEEAFQNRLELKAEEKPATVAHNPLGSTTNVIHKMEEVFSNRSEIKAEQKPAMVPHNHLRSTTNGVCRLEEAFSNRSELKAEEKPATVAALNWLGSTTNSVHKPEEAFPNRSELKAEAKPGTKPLGSTTNGVPKPKPLFSRGFLDRDSSAAKKSVDNVKKIQKERSEANTPIGSGHSNGYSEIKFDKLKNEKVNGDGSAKPVAETEASTSNGNGKVKGAVTDFNGQNKENASNVSKELALGEFANGGNHIGKFYFQLKEFSPEMFPQNENGANFAKPTGLVSTLVDGEYNYGKS